MPGVQDALGCKGSRSAQIANEKCSHYILISDNSLWELPPVKQFKQKVWIGIGAFVLAGTQVDFPGKGVPERRLRVRPGGVPQGRWRGGEGGEGGEAGRRAARANQGRLAHRARAGRRPPVRRDGAAAGGREGCRARASQASQGRDLHLAAPGLSQYHAAGFANELEQLSKAAGGDKGAAENAYRQVEKKIDLARQKAAGEYEDAAPGRRAPAQDAASDYRESLKNGRIADAKEYQDAYGFTKIAKRLIERTKPANDSERAALDIARGVLKETDSLWPSLPGDGIAGGDPAVLQAAASRIELAASGLR